MARIPAGSFVMGSPEDEQGRFEDESPQTNVTLSRDFYMGKYPVTQAQWLAVMEIWPEVEPSSMYGVGPDYPAHDISWHDTQDFLITLNAHIMRTNQGPATLRLPTEAEWEYAARAGTTTRFSFGDSLINVEGDSNGDRCEDDGIRSQHMWYCGNNAPLFESGYGIKPVGKKLPNAFGLYDMHGNVSEWCLDWWAESLPGGSVTDPTGPASGSCRVIRGGSWLTHASVCRSARRLFDEPTSRDPRQGFRVAAYR